MLSLTSQTCPNYNFATQGFNYYLEIETPISSTIESSKPIQQIATNMMETAKSVSTIVDNTFILKVAIGLSIATLTAYTLIKIREKQQIINILSKIIDAKDAEITSLKTLRDSQADLISNYEEQLSRAQIRWTDSQQIRLFLEQQLASQTQILEAFQTTLATQHQALQEANAEMQRARVAIEVLSDKVRNLNEI